VWVWVFGGREEGVGKLREWGVSRCVGVSRTALLKMLWKMACIHGHVWSALGWGASWQATRAGMVVHLAAVVRLRVLIPCSGVYTHPSGEVPAYRPAFLVQCACESMKHVQFEFLSLE
jgi:hypothetical protein